jgi:hypothetical protein
MVNAVDKDSVPIPEEPKKRGRPAGPQKTKESKPDPNSESIDTVNTIDEIQKFVSPKLAFTPAEKAFHERSVFLLVKKYDVSPTEAITVAHAGASVIMIVSKWVKHLWAWYEKPKVQESEKLKTPNNPPTLPPVTGL